MIEEDAMELVRVMVDSNRINIKMGIIENNPMFEALEIVYNRAACNIGLESIMSVKPDKEGL